MDIPEEFIRAHQISFPAFGDEIVETPFTIEFSPPLRDIELFLDDVFDGGKPFYMPGVCRPITPDHDRYSVGAIACPLPDEGEEDTTTYDEHYPLNHNVWFDVSADEMQVYVRDTVDVSRIRVFFETLGAQYGVELHEVVDLPALPDHVTPHEDVSS